MRRRDEFSLQIPSIPFDSPNHRGKNYLLIIAVDQYRNGINRLENAKRDALAFRDCLLEHYQFRKEDCIELLNKEATRPGLIRAFDQLIEQITEEDNLVFYFAGHGKLVHTIQEGYWLLEDAISGDRASYLSNNEVHKFIGNLRARHIFGVVDSCYSGTLFRSQEAAPPSNLYHYRSRYLLTSGRHEPVLDGFPGQHSPFADCLLEQLRKHPGPYFWVGDLCRAILNNIRFNVDEQTPRGEPLQKVGHQGGEFVFIRKGSHLPLSNSEAGKPEESQRKPTTDIANPFVKKEGEKVLFLFYAKEDEAFKNEFDVQLSSLKYSKKITVWDSGHIPRQSNWRETIKIALEQADIILLLMSPHLIHSGHPGLEDIKNALNLYQKEEALVIPVYIRPCFGENLPFSTIRGLPKNRKPIANWGNQDEAWLAVIQELHGIL